MKKNRVHRLFGGRFALPLLAAAGVCLAQNADAQIVVGLNGAGPLTFDSAPPASQFRYRSIAGGGNTFTDAATADAGVATNDVAAFTAALSTDTANPPGTSGNGRYNSTLDVIQTRPTGNGATLIIGVFTNASGSQINEMTIGYDFNSYNSLTGHLPGHRVYYSLTGLENSWLPIPGLSDTEIVGPLSATITPSWPADSLLYVLWFDDNADGITDPSYTIDNLSVSFPGQPPVIVQQPVGQTNNEYSTVTLSVAAGGTPPLSFQWTRNGSDIPGATSSTLVLTNLGGSGRTWSTPTDSGTYAVTVSGSVAPAVTSQPAQVLINADTNAPRLLWAIGQTNGAGNTTIRVRLNEQLNDPANLTNDTIYWTVAEVGGPNLLGDVLTAALVGNNEVVLDVQGEPDPTKSYTVEYFYSDTPIIDRAETPNAMAMPATLPLFVHRTTLLDFSSAWKYNDTDVDPGPTWMQPGFNDSDAETWATGAGPFDAKRNAAGTAGQDCRDTALHNLGPVGTCILLTSPQTATNIITYYFRTTVDYNGGTAPTNVMLVISGKSDDGHVVYLNGTEIDRVGMPAGPITHTTFANRTVGDGDAQDISYIAFPSTIQNGVNTIAVSMHNVNLSSSDATLGLRIESYSAAPGAPAGPRITTSRDSTSGAITLTWPGGGTLQTSSTLAPNSWSDVTGATSPYVINNPQGNAFFRVVQ